MALMIATGIGRFVFTPILPIMLDEQTVALNEVIWLSSANYIGYFVGAMSLFKNHRHLLLLVLGLVLVTVVTYFSGVHDFASIFLFRFLTGVGGAWALVSATAWAIPWLKNHKIKRVGYVYIGVGLGIFVSGTLCSLLILGDVMATQIWHAIALMACILTASVCFLLWRVLKNQHISLASVMQEDAYGVEAVDTSVEDSLEDNQPHVYPAVWRLAMAYGLFGFGYIIPSTFLPKIAKDMVSGDAFLLVWPVFGMASVIVVAFTQRFTHVSDLKIWRIAQSVLGAAVLLPVFFQNITSLIITALLVGGSFMVVIMSILKIAAHIDKPYNVVALVTACFAFGQLAGPLSALFLTGDDIWHFVLPLSCFVLFLGVAFIWQRPKVS